MSTSKNGYPAVWVSGVPSASTGLPQGQQKHIRGVWIRVILAGMLSMVCMGTLAGLLTWILFSHHYEVSSVEGYSNSAYLFLHWIRPAIPLLLTSLSTILSIVLLVAMKTLASFVLAHDMLVKSEQIDVNGLPTVYELGLLMSTINAGASSIFGSIKQRLEPGRHALLAKALFLTTVPLFTSVLIAICDVAVHAASTQLVAPLPAYGVSGSYQFARTLASNCHQAPFYQTAEFWLNDTECSNRLDLITGASEATATASNRSTLNRVVISEPYNLPDFHVAPIAILTDARAPASEAFIATSYGVASWFMNIGQNCQLNGTADSWNCEDHKFSGSFETSNVAIPDASMFDFSRNKIEWVVAAKVTSDTPSFSLFNQEPYEYNVVVDNGNSSMMTVFHCETAAYQVTYLQQNGQVTVQGVSPVNITTAPLIFGGVFPGMILDYPGFGKDMISEEFTTGAKTSQDVLDLGVSWATTLSTVAMASAAGILLPATVTEQDLTSSVTLIPKAPFIAIVVADFIYTAFALGLTVASIRAIFDRRHASIQTPDVQARLSIVGLTSRALCGEAVYGAPASHVRELFDNSTTNYGNRVLVRQTGAGGLSLEADGAISGHTTAWPRSGTPAPPSLKTYTEAETAAPGYGVVRNPKTPENPGKRVPAAP